MAKYKFTPGDVERLFEERYLHPHPHIQRRLEALYLKSQGMKHQEICKLLRISRASIFNWLEIFKNEGIEGVKQLKYRKKWGKLTANQESLEEYFRKNPPRSTREASQVIKKITGLERSKTSVHRFLKIIGLSYRKTGIVPGKADVIKQEEFKKNSWGLS